MDSLYDGDADSFDPCSILGLKMMCMFTFIHRLMKKHDEKEFYESMASLLFSGPSYHCDSRHSFEVISSGQWIFCYFLS